MKYIIYLLAAVPTLGAAFAFIVFSVMSIENPLWILACVVNIYTFAVCYTHYPDTLRGFAIYLKTILYNILAE